MGIQDKPYLIAEILFLRGLPLNVIKTITSLADEELQSIKEKFICS
ncbi:hypothetical protein [Peribacillus kribbensis]|nr:hypothetical protein [Peribacillus kribbensis]